MKAKSINKIGKWTYCSEIYEVFENCDAVVFITEWEEFKFINWEKASSYMSYPAWVFDCRSIINSDKAEEHGLKVWSLGKNK